MDDLVWWLGEQQATGSVRINEAVAEALDAIGDDPAYEEARRDLEEAARLLSEGTTAEAQAALERGLASVDAACPV